MRALIAMTLCALASSARAEPAEFVARPRHVIATSAGLIDELRLGLQYEQGVIGAEPVAPRWRGWRLTAVAGLGFSSLGAGHGSDMTVPTADGGALWLAARGEYGSGGVIDGWSTEFGFALAAGPVVNVVEDVQRASIAYRPGVVMRVARFHLTFSMALEHNLYARSRRLDLVEDGWINSLTPGVEVGIGVAF